MLLQHQRHLQDAEHQGREVLQDALRKAGLPSQRIVGTPLFAGVIQEMGFRRAEDFYISLGSGKTSAQVVVNKIIAGLKTQEGEVTVDPSPQPARSGRMRQAGVSSDMCQGYVPLASDAWRQSTLTYRYRAPNSTSAHTRIRSTVQT